MMGSMLPFMTRIPCAAREISGWVEMGVATACLGQEAGLKARRRLSFLGAARKVSPGKAKSSGQLMDDRYRIFDQAPFTGRRYPPPKRILPTSEMDAGRR